jgi:hypothetical protein
MRIETDTALSMTQLMYGVPDRHSFISIQAHEGCYIISWNDRLLSQDGATAFRGRAVGKDSVADRNAEIAPLRREAGRKPKPVAPISLPPPGLRAR